MAIVLQPERLDWNQSDVIPSKWVQISKIKLNLAKMTHGGCIHYKMTRKEPNQYTSTEMSKCNMNSIDFYYVEVQWNISAHYTQ